MKHTNHCQSNERFTPHFETRLTQIEHTIRNEILKYSAINNNIVERRRSIRNGQSPMSKQTRIQKTFIYTLISLLLLTSYQTKRSIIAFYIIFEVDCFLCCYILFRVSLSPYPSHQCSTLYVLYHTTYDVYCKLLNSQCVCIRIRCSTNSLISYQHTKKPYSKSKVSK